ncbi:MAG TPA: glycosyltransferase family 39 protein [Phycisphaerae bacterium]|nr:glycosyltransferase family 39 protein [Phycisphaerae bacterium]
MNATGDASYRRWLSAIVIAAIVVRVALQVFAELRPALFDFPDSHRYIRVAQNIAAGRGPIDDERMRAGTDPLYPLILAIAPLFGLDDAPVIMRFGRACNGAFGVASILLLAGIARGLFDRRSALFAAALLALDPILLFFNALVLTESLYILLLLASFYAIVRIRVDLAETGTAPHGWGLLAGACMGLATLARSTNLLFPFLIAILLQWFMNSNAARAVPIRRRVLMTSMFLFSSVLVLTPTLIRNHKLYGRIVPVRIGSGASLMEALGPWADGSPGMNRIVYPDFPTHADEYERDRICRATAIDWATANPGRALSLAWAKLKRTWSIVIHAADYASPLLKLACWMTVAPEFALAAVGIWLNRRRPAILALLLAPALYFTLVHMVFVGSVRYRVPAMPLLFILAATAIVRLLPARVESRPH